MKNIPYEKTYINITLKRHMITIMSPKKARINNNYRFRKEKSKTAQRSSIVKEKMEGGGGLTGKLKEMKELYIPSF